MCSLDGCRPMRQRQGLHHSTATMGAAMHTAMHAAALQGMSSYVLANTQY